MRNLDAIELLKKSEGKEIEVIMNSGEDFKGELTSYNMASETSTEIKIKLRGRFVPMLCIDRIMSVRVISNKRN